MAGGVCAGAAGPRRRCGGGTAPAHGAAAEAVVEAAGEVPGERTALTVTHVMVLSTARQRHARGPGRGVGDVGASNPLVKLDL